MGASVSEATGACCRPTVDVAGNVPAGIVPAAENTAESGSSSVSDSFFYSSCDTADPVLGMVPIQQTQIFNQNIDRQFSGWCPSSKHILKLNTNFQSNTLPPVLGLVPTFTSMSSPSLVIAPGSMVSLLIRLQRHHRYLGHLGHLVGSSRNPTVAMPLTPSKVQN